MIYFDLNEAYLDDNQEFWDYHTKMFDGRNPFDTTKGESPFVKQLLGDPDYMADYKNLTSEIVQMTPREYFEGCAEIFDSSVDAQINQIKDDKTILTKLQKVLNVYRRTFPITYLNYAERGQEGRHRMYVVGEMLGWDKKFPVLVINWYNQELADKEAAKKMSEINEAYDRIKNGTADFDFLEVMACPGGCVMGGGQPIVSSKKRMDVDVRKLRAEALYTIDKESALRKSHENPVVIKIYKEYLGDIGGHKAHELLHTHYTKREKYS